MQRKQWFNIVILIGCALAAAAEPASRTTLSLDGRWQIAEGAMDAAPAKFERDVVVPGLVDMARPPFVEPGPKVAERGKAFPQKDPRLLEAMGIHYAAPEEISGAAANISGMKKSNL